MNRLRRRDAHPELAFIFEGRDRGRSRKSTRVSTGAERDHLSRNCAEHPASPACKSKPAALRSRKHAAGPNEPRIGAAEANGGIYLSARGSRRLRKAVSPIPAFCVLRGSQMSDSSILNNAARVLQLVRLALPPIRHCAIRSPRLVITRPRAIAARSVVRFSPTIAGGAGWMKRNRGKNNCPPPWNCRSVQQKSPCFQTRGAGRPRCARLAERRDGELPAAWLRQLQREPGFVDSHANKAWKQESLRALGNCTPASVDGISPSTTAYRYTGTAPILSHG